MEFGRIPQKKNFKFLYKKIEKNNSNKINSENFLFYIPQKKLNIPHFRRKNSAIQRFRVILRKLSILVEFPKKKNFEFYQIPRFSYTLFTSKMLITNNEKIIVNQKILKGFW